MRDEGAHWMRYEEANWMRDEGAHLLDLIYNIIAHIAVVDFLHFLKIFRWALFMSHTVV